MFDVISKDYKDLLTKKHDDKPWGGAGASWIHLIAPLLNRFNDGAEVLDYGCGRGKLKPALLEVRPDIIVTEYDPGVRGKDALPTVPVNFVVCTDVLEHIEQDKIGAVLKHLDWLSKDGIFLNIVFTPSRSFLPNGDNTHILQRPRDWWWEKLTDEETFPAMEWTIHRDMRDYLVVSGYRNWGIYRDV